MRWQYLSNKAPAFVTAPAARGRPRFHTGDSGAGESKVDSDADDAKSADSDDEDADTKAAFKNVTHGPPPDILFEQGDGFDLFIDGARFLPDNVGLSKVSVKLFDPSWKKLVSPSQQTADLDTPCHMPEYSLYAEYRLDT